ncbi:gliding motility-associated C-terminal domain-containing protein [Arenibacter sp. BSSL-BM3]|uniref:Gliding motility-associated C-terminal domain-containing protein n=1 Tax=Arenibacter arenosicollis TaxID=2762274 RepID=A0ABR7QJ29_9FLAO|nr:Calx-beta domain-containing protein [Arenibacter arenosicollis]MBC8767186.1 gliding motility-associated C-terminal domain-containing protein [Arenibacter arenosicollis]
MKEPVMKIISQYNILSILLVSFRLKCLLLLGAMLMLSSGINGQIIAIEASDPDASEAGLNNGQFRVFNSEAIGSDITVLYSVSGSATGTGNTDYLALSGSITLPGGTGLPNEAVINVTSIVDDLFIEGDETVVVTLDNTDFGAIGTQDEATVTIQDNDASVQFSTANSSAQEDVGNNLPTLIVNGRVESGSSGIVLTLGGTATIADYSLPSTTVNIPPGLYNNTAVSTGLSIISDAIVETDETIILGFGGQNGDIVATNSPTSSTYTIINDDIVAVSFSSAAGSGPENTGDNLPTLFVTGTVTATTNVTVTNSGTGTATSGVDFTFASPQVVAIPVGVYDGTAATEIPIPSLAITNDSSVEPNETIVLGLSGATGDASLGAITSTTYTILNDDNDVMSIGGGVTLSEGNTGATAFNFTASRTGSTAAAATTTFTVTSTGANPANAADFGGSFPTGTATFAIGSSTAAIAINVSGDTTVEPNETFAVTLSGPSAGYTIGTATALGTITNDDSDDMSMGGNVTQSEGNAGSTTFNFTANRTGSTAAAATATFTVTGSGADPANGADFVGGTFPSGTANFAIGSSTATITINVNGDTTVEPNETFSVTLSAPTAGYAVGTATALGTITNDDNDVMSMGGGVTLSEGNSGTTAFNFTASRTGSTAASATASFTVTGSGADPANGTDFVGGTLPGGTANFAIGSSTAAITINVSGDTAVEPNETFTVTLSGPSPGYTIGAPATAQGTITNDDSYIASITANDPTSTEAGTTTGQFTVDLGTINTTGSAIVVNYTIATGGSNATNTTDYGTLSGSVSIANNQRSGLITVAPVDDELVEGPETVILTLATGTGYTLAVAPNNTATVTIEDNDSYIATITATTPDASESPLTAGSYTVGLNTANITGNPIVVNYTVGGTATPDSDYIAPSGTVSIPNAQESSTITVTPINDTEVEAAESVNVTLRSGTGYNVGSPNNATVSITSEDRAGVSIDDVLVNEGDGSASFTVTLNRAVLFGTNVTYSTANNTATAGSDYVSKSGSVSFLGFNGETKTIVIDILEDTVSEGTETFFVNLNNATGFAQIGKAQGIGTIADNDNCIEAPLINTTPTIFCEDFKQDLDAYTDTVIPSGFELIWSSSSDFSITGARLGSSEVDFAATFYGFLFNSGSGCVSPPLEVTLVRNEPPEILSTTPTTICGPGTATISATVSAGGSLFWYSSTSDSLPLGEGSTFTTPNNTATTIYYVEASANQCVSERIGVTVTMADPVLPGTTTDDAACSITGGGPTTLDLDTTRTGGTSGEWTIVGTPPGTVTIGSDNVVDFEGAADGEYIFRFTTNTAVSPCVNESVDVTIAVTTCTVDSDGDGIINRDENALGLDPNNRDTDADGIDDGVEVGPDISNPIDTDDDGIIDALDSNILDSDNDGIVDQLDPANNNPCIPNISDACQIDLGIEKVVDLESVLVEREVTFTVTLTNLSQIMVSNVAVNDLVSPALGFEYISSTVTSGTYNEIAGVWQLDEILADEVNTLTITARVPEIGTYQNVAAIVDSFPEDSNATNNTATATVTVTPRSTSECGFLFNQISPNGDGFNDAVYINCIEDYPNNTLEIYDRYGNEVFKASSYDNTWMGTGKNGDLPKGTYFYILDLGDGTEVRKGWIQIIR